MTIIECVRAGFEVRIFKSTHGLSVQLIKGNWMVTRTTPWDELDNTVVDVFPTVLGMMVREFDDIAEVIYWP